MNTPMKPEEAELKRIADIQVQLMIAPAQVGLAFMVMGMNIPLMLGANFYQNTVPRK